MDVLRAWPKFRLNQGGRGKFKESSWMIGSHPRRLQERSVREVKGRALTQPGTFMSKAGMRG